MKTTYPKELREFLKFHAQQMVDCLVLGHYFIYLSFKGRMTATMEVNVDNEYLEAHIAYGKEVVSKWKEGDKSYILRSLIHELTHIITSELADSMRGKMDKKHHTFHDERCTETVSRIAYRLYWRWLKDRTIPKGMEFEP